MADAEDIQPLVCDNGTGMVKVSSLFPLILYSCVVAWLDLSICSNLM